MLTKATDPLPAAHDRVYRTLRSRIMHGELDPGVALTLRGIGKEFDVSLTPAREAVRRLVAEGALTLSASGRVTTPDLTSERIEELASLRALIETELASRALPRAHLALIERLSIINNSIAEAIVKKAQPIVPEPAKKPAAKKAPAKKPAAKKAPAKKAAPKAKA